MNKYPGIYKAQDGTIYYYLNKKKFFSPHRGRWEEDCDNDDHKTDVNITAEYLANTYGKVESKEHAEFIVKLAESAGFEAGSIERQDGWFCFTEKHLYFYPTESRASDAKEKLITIPLPPKEKPMKSQKEWPQVGDEFIHKGELVKCISKGVTSDGSEVITFEGSDKLSHGSCWNNDSWVKKPPTPEEELANKLDESALATIEIDDLIKLSKAIINGEIEGLEYKPQ